MVLADTGLTHSDRPHCLGVSSMATSTKDMDPTGTTMTTTMTNNNNNNNMNGQHDSPSLSTTSVSAPFHLLNDQDMDSHRTAQQIEQHPSDANHSTMNMKWMTWSSYGRSVYMLELLLCIILCLVGINIRAVLGQGNAEPHQRPIPSQALSTGQDYVRNLVYNEVYQGETVPDTALYLSTVLMPLLIQLGLCCCTLITCVNARRKHHPCVLSVHATLCVYLVAFGLSSAVVDLLKYYVGYLRPIFYDGCQPNETLEYCTVAGSNNNNNEDATAHLRKSFPSGHAACAFTGMTLLTLFLHQHYGLPSILRTQQQQQQHKQHLSNAVSHRPLIAQDDSQLEQQQLQQQQQQQHHHDQSLINPVVAVADNDDDDDDISPRILLLHRFISICSLIPMSIAIWIAATRVYDNVHFPADIVAGSILGSTIANFVHSLWF